MSMKLEISAIIFGYNIRIIINNVTSYHESCSKYLYIYCVLEFISKKEPACHPAIHTDGKRGAIIIQFFLNISSVWLA